MSEILHRINATTKDARMKKRADLQKKLQSLLCTASENRMSTKVVNLSKRDLSSTEISLLSKGIRFSHTDAAPTDFLANLESLLLTSDVPDDMCADIRSCATGLLRQRKHHQTLPTEEKKALRSLKTDDKIVIMSADKGGATVIMDKVDYVNKANQVFDDREAYAPLAADPTKKQTATIKKKVNELARLKLISPDDGRSMTLNDPRIARAYGLPKVHKTDAPLRIIVPLIGSPTYNLAKWLYKHLKHFANGSQYSIKNSQVFLQKIQGLEGISEALSRQLKRFGISIAHKPASSLRETLCRVKDPVTKEQLTNVIYRIPCANCPCVYIGHTGRCLGPRINEHKLALRRRDPLSLVFAHAIEHDHRFNWDGTEVIAKANTRQAREFLEAWHSGTTSINRHVDLDAHYEGLRTRSLSSSHTSTFANPHSAT
ncbi:hypothetical protein SprV_0100456300 [Sparganum proliferum]